MARWKFTARKRVTPVATPDEIRTAFRTYRRCHGHNLGEFLAHYHKLWKAANRCDVTHCEGIRRLLDILPPQWKGWAREESRRFIQELSPTYSPVGDFPGFIGLLQYQFITIGSAPVGPYWPYFEYARLEMEPEIPIVLPTHTPIERVRRTHLFDSEAGPSVPPPPVVPIPPAAGITPPRTIPSDDQVVPQRDIQAQDLPVRKRLCIARDDAHIREVVVISSSEEDSSTGDIFLWGLMLKGREEVRALLPTTFQKMAACNSGDVVGVHRTAGPDIGPWGGDVTKKSGRGHWV